MRRQTRYKQVGNQDLEKESSKISTWGKLVLHEEIVQLSPPQGGIYVLNKEANMIGPL